VQIQKTENLLVDEVVPEKPSVYWLNDELYRDEAYRGLERTKLSFPLSVEQAREIKPYLRIVLA